DRQARVTDFDRAYIEGSGTVFERTKSRGRNPASVPPELSNSSEYDFDSAADMYSFGVLLYELLVDTVPFESAAAAAEAMGKPTKLPSAVRDGIDPEIDRLTVELLNTTDF